MAGVPAMPPGHPARPEHGPASPRCVQSVLVRFPAGARPPPGNPQPPQFRHDAADPAKTVRYPLQPPARRGLRTQSQGSPKGATAASFQSRSYPGPATPVEARPKIARFPMCARSSGSTRTGYPSSWPSTGTSSPMPVRMPGHKDTTSFQISQTPQLLGHLRVQFRRPGFGEVSLEEMPHQLVNRAVSSGCCRTFRLLVEALAQSHACL